MGGLNTRVIARVGAREIEAGSVSGSRETGAHILLPSKSPDVSISRVSHPHHQELSVGCRLAALEVLIGYIEIDLQNLLGFLQVYSGKSKVCTNTVSDHRPDHHITTTHHPQAITINKL
eukprot:1157486-Amorphochlora_amoeboformis.AAC.1